MGENSIHIGIDNHAEAAYYYYTAAITMRKTHFRILGFFSPPFYHLGMDFIVVWRTLIMA